MIFQKRKFNNKNDNVEKEYMGSVYMNLTSREIDVLRYLCKGCSDEEIAQNMFISVNTVKTHIRNMLEKLFLRDRTQLVIYAYENNVLSKNHSKE